MLVYRNIIFFCLKYFISIFLIHNELEKYVSVSQFFSVFTFKT